MAKAQAYFASLAEACRLYLDTENVERVITRGEISKEQINLDGVAKEAGVVSYPYLHSAGYRGLYNMSITRLRMLKRMPEGRTPLDFMGSEELAAHLFRLTQTRARIKKDRFMVRPIWSA